MIKIRVKIATWLRKLADRLYMPVYSGWMTWDEEEGKWASPQ